LLAQEAGLLGILHDPKNWFLSDEFDELKAGCWIDPAYGTSIVGRAYVRKALRVGTDRASRWWQKGFSWFGSRKEYLSDPYLKVIKGKEKLFDRCCTRP
jgi:hypothetical protein